jgi:hypothetical protein
MAQVVEGLPSKSETLNSNPSTTKKKKKKGGGSISISQKKIYKRPTIYKNFSMSLIKDMQIKNTMKYSITSV